MIQKITVSGWVLMLMLMIPTVQAINITCDWDYVCSGDNLRRISDCSVDNVSDPFPLYVDEGLNCEFGCDPEYNQCVIPPYYEALILLPVIFGSLFFARWVWVKKSKGVRRR